MGFAENLKFIMVELDIDKNYLYEETGIPINRISRFRHGTSEPNDYELKIICSYLKMPSQWMLQENDLKKKIPYIENHPLKWQPNLVKTKIKCLRCKEIFESEGSHNRICEICKSDKSFCRYDYAQESTQEVDFDFEIYDQQQTTNKFDIKYNLKDIKFKT